MVWAVFVYGGAIRRRNAAPDHYFMSRMTLIIARRAFGGFANLSERPGGATASECKANALNTGPHGQGIYGESTLVKMDKRQSVWQMQISLEGGVLVAVVTHAQIDFESIAHSHLSIKAVIGLGYVYDENPFYRRINLFCQRLF